MEPKTQEKVEHTLTLKGLLSNLNHEIYFYRKRVIIIFFLVMRLTKPALSSPLIVTNESKDLPEDILNNDLKNDITTVNETETLAVGQFLLIPQSFGTIHLGESFLGYILIHNDSNQIAKNVHVKADLQTVTQKIPLLEHKLSELSPHKTIDQVINHEVKEIGTHMLVF